MGRSNGSFGQSFVNTSAYYKPITNQDRLLIKTNDSNTYPRISISRKMEHRTPLMDLGDDEKMKKSGFFIYHKKHPQAQLVKRGL
ncbi:hypothetical protein Bca4012_063104 [Brassica carinata]